MLDTDTKRRIDTARDILVGKVPEDRPRNFSQCDRMRFGRTCRSRPPESKHKAREAADRGLR